MIEYVFAVSGLMVLISLVRGPTFADRSLAAGVFVNIIVIIMLLYAVRTSAEPYLDLSIVMIFMSFVGTLAIARYTRRNK